MFRILHDVTDLRTNYDVESFSDQHQLQIESLLFVFQIIFLVISSQQKDTIRFVAKHF